MKVSELLEGLAKLAADADNHPRALEHLFQFPKTTPKLKREIRDAGFDFGFILHPYVHVTKKQIRVDVDCTTATGGGWDIVRKKLDTNDDAAISRELEKMKENLFFQLEIAATEAGGTFTQSSSSICHITFPAPAR